MHTTSKGQVTIPIEKRRKYGITPDVEIEFEDTDRGLLIVVEREERKRRFEEALKRMQRTGDDFGMTTDEYMNMLRGYDEDDDDPGFAS